MPQAVLYDFDYTLADSSRGVIACVNHALSCLGLADAAPARICETIGLSMPAAFEYLTGDTAPERAARFSQHFISHADQVMADLTLLYPAVPQVVRTLHAAHIVQGIVSSKLRYRIVGIVEREGLADYFSIILGAEDMPHHKPHPDGLLAALAHIGCPPDAAVYVGDHPVDAKAAAQAGIAFVAVLTGVSTKGMFAAYPAYAVIDNIAALPELFALEKQRAGA